MFVWQAPIMGEVYADTIPYSLLEMRKKYMRKQEKNNFVVDFPSFPVVSVFLCPGEKIFRKNNFLTEKNGVGILPYEIY